MAAVEQITVGDGEAARAIAIKRRHGGQPGIFWLGGFMSDMEGTKALALDAFAAAHGRAMTRFDYSGHGASGSTFAEGTISRWLEEARAVFDTTEGPQIVVGSSMGGWIALLLADAQRRSRIAGLVLIAPAVDMTEALIWPGLSKAEQKQLMREGSVREKSAYDPAGYLITRNLIEDGKKHLFGNRLIEPGCPVHILQGNEDPDVPAAHAMALVTRLASDDVVLTLIKDGDHRLSRPEDLERLIAAVSGLVEHST